MFALDISAHTNAYRSVHPAEKAAFTAAALAGSLLGRTAVPSLAVFFISCGLLLFGARVRLKILLHFFSIPLLFLLAGLPALLVSVVPDSAETLLTFSVRGIRLGITPAAAERALLLTSRATGACAGFAFLVLTTPVFALDQVFSRMRVPPVLRSLAILMYRFIFITLHTAETIRLSQRARGGYTGIVRSLRSAGSLAGSLFAKSYTFAKLSHGALVLRGFDENFELVPVEYPRSAKNRKFILLFCLFLVFLLVLEAA